MVEMARRVGVARYRESVRPVVFSYPDREASPWNSVRVPEGTEARG